MAEHTPGPWNVVLDHRSNGNAKRGHPNSDAAPMLLVCGPAGAPVITRRGLAKPSKMVGQANARLIAAAPELLRSLKEISDMLMARPDIAGKLAPLFGPAEKATFERAAAAVAKAEGR